MNLEDMWVMDKDSPLAHNYHWQMVYESNENAMEAVLIYVANCKVEAFVLPSALHRSRLSSLLQHDPFIVIASSSLFQASSHLFVNSPKLFVNLSLNHHLHVYKRCRRIPIGFFNDEVGSAAAFGSGLLQLPFVLQPGNFL